MKYSISPDEMLHYAVFCSMFCCTLLYVHSSIAIILMGKRELIALLILSFWCLVMVERLFLAVPRGCLQFVIVVFPDHTHLLFFIFKLAFGIRQSSHFGVIHCTPYTPLQYSVNMMIHVKLSSIC